MTDDRRVSVIIPAFNADATLERAVESVLRQTHPAMEIIVINDGSSDSTHEVASRLPVRYFRQENLGAGAARNRGIGVAEGEWVAFLDSDDEFLPNMLEDLLEGARTVPHARVISGAHLQETRQGLIRRPIQGAVLRKGQAVGEINFFREVMRHSVAWTGKQLIAREVFDKVGVFDTRKKTGQDIELWSLMAGNFPWCFVDKEVAIYHVNERSITRSLPVSKWNEGDTFIFKDEQEYLDRIERRYWNDFRCYRKRELLYLTLRAFQQDQIIASRRYLQAIGWWPTSLAWWIAVSIAYIPGVRWAYRLVRPSLQYVLDNYLETVVRIVKRHL